MEIRDVGDGMDAVDSGTNSISSEAGNAIKSEEVSGNDFESIFVGVIMAFGVTRFSSTSLAHTCSTTILVIVILPFSVTSSTSDLPFYS